MIDVGKLQPGMYLIGRDDGTIDPFFARVTHCDEVSHHVSHALIEHAITQPGWWWRPMIVTRVPDSFDSYPDVFHEPGTR